MLIVDYTSASASLYLPGAEGVDAVWWNESQFGLWTIFVCVCVRLSGGENRDVLHITLHHRAQNWYNHRTNFFDECQTPRNIEATISSTTPPKFNMELKNEGLEEDVPFQLGELLGSSRSFSGVNLWYW